jgi:hypothetical protein
MPVKTPALCNEKWGSDSVHGTLLTKRSAWNAQYSRSAAFKVPQSGTLHEIAQRFHKGLTEFSLTFLEITQNLT